MATVFLTHHTGVLVKQFGASLLAELRAFATVRTNPLARPPEARELVELAAGCEIVITDRATAVPSEVFEQLPALLALQRVAVDIRNIDVDAASRAGVLVTRASPGFDAAVAEWTLGAMVDLARHLTASTIEYRAGRMPDMRMGRQLRGSRLGIIGYGTIGRTLAAISLALGMQVAVADPYANVDDARIEPLPVDELLSVSDFVVCLAVANAQTENLLDERRFGLMKPGAFFINPSRGNLVDEAALWDALESGRLAGAALDVGREPDQMPSRPLAARADVIATPHIGGHTPEAIAHQARDAVQQAAAILRGTVPPGAVNAAAATRLHRRGSQPS